MAITSAGGARPRRSRQRRSSSSGGRKRPSSRRLRAERMIHRAGHVAGDRVDGLDRAGKALRRARIDEQGALDPRSASISSSALSAARRSDVRRAAESRRADCPAAVRRLAGLERAAGAQPRFEAAVEHGDLCAPASAAATRLARRTSRWRRRRRRPGCSRIAPGRGRSRRAPAVGQGMAAARGRDGRRQVAVQVDIARAGDVAAQVRLPAGVRVRRDRSGNRGPRSPGADQSFAQRSDVDEGLEVHDSSLARCREPCIRYNPLMALTLYWGSGSPYSWRVLLALEHKRLPYESQLLHFDKQEHQSPQMLKMNPRGRVPVLKDGDYVVFESVAVLYYLDVKYPAGADLRRDARGGRRHHARHLRVSDLCRAVALEDRERDLQRRRRGALEELTDAMHVVGREARTIEGRLSKEQWIVGANYSAADMVIFPVDSAAAPGSRIAARRRSSARASCRWSGTIPRSRAGSAASNRFRATSGPIRRIGARRRLVQRCATRLDAGTQSTPARP